LGFNYALAKAKVLEVKAVFTLVKVCASPLNVLVLAVMLDCVD
jgi:hypothetical protein